MRILGKKDVVRQVGYGDVLHQDAVTVVAIGDEHIPARLRVRDLVWKDALEHDGVVLTTCGEVPNGVVAVTRPEEEGIGSWSAIKGVVTALASDRIISLIAGDPVIALSSRDGVITCRAVDDSHVRYLSQVWC